MSPIRVSLKFPSVKVDVTPICRYIWERVSVTSVSVSRVVTSVSGSLKSLKFRIPLFDPVRAHSFGIISNGVSLPSF